QEARVWNLLTKNGLVRDLANSFLVFAFTGSRSLQDITDSWLVKSFSGRGKKRYLIETIFQKEHDKVVVDKRLCYPLAASQPPDEQRAVRHHIGRTEYIKGVPYDSILLDHVSSDDPLSGLIRYLTPWVDWIREHALQNESGHDEKQLVSGALYECMPSNFLLNRQGELCLIDQEWEYNELLEIGFVLFRGLYREFSVNMDLFQQVDLFRNTSMQSVQEVFEKIFKVFDIHFDQETVNRYIDLEVAVQLELVPYSIDRVDLTEFLQKFFHEPRIKKISFSELLKSGGTERFGLLVRQKDILNQVLAERDEAVQTLNQAVWDRDATIESLNQKVAELDNDLMYLKAFSGEYHKNYLTVTGSSSWRWTAPLRLAGYLARGDFDKVAMAGRSLADRLLEKLRPPLPLEAESEINNPALNAIIRERCQNTAELPLADPLAASSTDDLPPVDITAVTFNSEKWIPDFIESLLALDYPNSLLTICFVDNGSSDATLDHLRKGVAQLTVDGYAAADIIQQKNLGYGAGHNRAIQQGIAPFCLVTNVDLTFEPEALKRVAATARVDTAAAAWELRQIPYEHPKFYDPVTGLTNWNSHACILLRRSKLEEVGLYDEALFMYGEDVELSYRLRRSGAVLRYCPHATVRHYSYTHAEQIKPLQYTGSTFANLYLRLKYGTFNDIQDIPLLVRHLLFTPEPYPGARRTVAWNILRLLLITPKALAGRRKSINEVYFPFYTWDYELVRDGAFITTPEVSEKPPLISVITRTYQGRELYLRQAL
ncbi:MAG: glycosyltransferase family 2 protein, partial [Candidatus Electrothrix sp. MAN1_4]|nr:glycosyltransferase family 2 protein [Candidatus Electrothrix sp. MAN1_4]